MVRRYEGFIKDVANSPFWQYVAVMDLTTRPNHAVLNGKVFRYNDPIWNTHFPPNGVCCRCRVRALDKNDMKEKGLKIERSDSPLRQIQPDKGFDHNPAKTEILYI